jgi:hypothetical protein
MDWKNWLTAVATVWLPAGRAAAKYRTTLGRVWGVKVKVGVVHPAEQEAPRIFAILERRASAPLKSL